ncbi:pyridoxamine 5'-phosphate oxidase family protein [Moheibacter lacus]|uniref:Pyridoxamine 5'-phosphate oxidase family protein n=1 Tax=Moheibacter lacus TaxID=2745851 RepID=A0A838ZMN6_9FLAO|nr:pyridoxamine 5'-phosphate oxidase family protein [Moheibacter lacus]MBA5628347.1 pyridoxamine 5'-phosphate oxidase family protein [Moheibacter lacus]
MSNIIEDQKKVKPKAPKIGELIENTKSVILGTIDAEGNPNSSYAPFANLNGSFQVLVSFMAKHTKNLRDQKKVSVMLIEDETAHKQIYARNRLTLDCEAVLVDNESEFFNESVKALEARHGNIVKMLAELNDFVLFDLRPKSGSYVNGFGSAYSVNPDLTVNEHVKGAHGQHNVEESK